MQGSRVAAWACVAGFNTLFFISGCSEQTPTSTPDRPVDPNACVEIGRCSFDGPKDDGNPCTTDGCDACNNTTHEVLPNNVACAGGSQCMATGFCLNGTCKQEALPDGTQCGFVDPCTPPGTCTAGTCITESAPMCKPEDFCSFGKCISQCFGTSWTLNFSQNAWITAVDIADVSGDAVPDVLMANQGAKTVTLLINNGSGIFEIREIAAGPDPVSLVATELTGDGMVDLAIANAVWNTVTVMQNDGNGYFTPAALYPVAFMPAAIASGDVNADGKSDLIVGSIGDNTEIFLHESNGLFSTSTVQDGGKATVVVDLDGDNDLDLGMASPFTQSVSTLMNTGNGTFNVRTQYPIAAEAYAITSADLDADGDIDLAAVSVQYNLMHILRNKGDGTFAPSEDIITAQSPAAIVAGDMNLDGLPDLAVLHQFDGTMAIHVNMGGGKFKAPRWYDVGANPAALAIDDLDLDGKPDIVVASGLGFVRFILNTCLQDL